MKKFLSVLLVFIISAVCCGCSVGNVLKAHSDFPVTVGDVKISSEPKRIVSLSPSVTAVLCMLGAKEKIVGVSSDSAWDGEIMRVGTASAPDVTLITSTLPDLVISNSELDALSLKQLALNNIKVITVSPSKSYDGLYDYYYSLAAPVFGTYKGEDAATVAKMLLESQTESIKSAVAAISEKVRIAVVPDDGYIVTGDSVFAPVIDSATCFQNIAAGETEYTMTPESITVADPQIIFCNTGLTAAVQANPAFAGTTAVKNSSVIEVPVTSMMSQGTAMFDVVRTMISSVYPDIVFDASESVVSTTSEDSQN